MARRNSKEALFRPKLQGFTVDISTQQKDLMATAQTRPSNGILVAGLGGYQMGGRPIVLRQLLLWW